MDREDGELVKAKETIKELSAIIAQQEQVIQRALFSTSGQLASLENRELN